MIKTAAMTKGDQTREKCVAGVMGLLARLDRRLGAIKDRRETCHIVVEITSAHGVLSAVESESKHAEAVTFTRTADEIVEEFINEIDSLVLPDVHKTIKIEINSVNGVLNAAKTEIRRHRWDI